MSGNQIALAFRIAADITALKANLAEGIAQIETTASSMKRMANSLDGSRLISDANAMVKAISDLGGVSKLTEAEQRRVNDTVGAAIDKYAALGKSAPLALLALQEATEHADGASEGFFGKLVAGVATGELLKDALEKLGEVGVEAFVKMGEALPELIAHTIEVGNHLYEMSLKTGASVENLSKLRYVASQTGIEFDTFGTSIFKMEKFLGSTGEAAVKAQETLNRLGLDLNALKNEKPDEAFIDVISALEQIPNRAEQAAAGAAIFSKGFKDMAGLAQEDIHDLMEEAEKLGIVMSTETAAAAHAAAVGFDSLKMQLEAVGLKIGAAFLPAVIGLGQAIGTTLKDAVDRSNRSLDNMGGGNGFLATVAKAMGTGNGAIAAQVTLYETLRDALIGFARNGIEPALTASGFLMQEFDASRALLAMSLQGYQGLTYGIEQLVLWMLKLDSVMPGSAHGNQTAIAAVQKDMDRLYNSMAQNDAAIQKLKKSEDDWADGAKSANAQIETALGKLGSTHTDVAAIIQRFVTLSHNAYGGVGGDVDTVGGKAKTATDELAKFADKIWGTEAITAAEGYAAMLGDANNLMFVTRDRQIEIAHAMENAINVYRAAGDEIPEDLAAIDLKARVLSGTVLDMVKAFSQVPQMFGPGIIQSPSAATAATLTGGGPQVIPPSVITSSDTLRDMAFALYPQKTTQGIGEVSKAVDELSRSFAQLAQIAGDSLGGLIREIGTVVSSVDMAGKGFKAIAAGEAQGGLSGALQKVSGVIAIVSAGLQILSSAWNHFFGTAGRDAVTSFVTQNYGSFDGLHAKLNEESGALKAVGIDSETLWKTLTQGVGRNNPQQAQAAIDQITKALAAADTASGNFNNSLNPLLSKLSGLGGTLNSTLVDALKKTGLLTADNTTLLSEMANTGGPSLQQLTDLQSRYNLTAAQMGKGFEQAKENVNWQQLTDDIQTATDAGLDMDGVLAGMAPKIQEMVIQSETAGTKMPSNLQPIVQKLLDAHQISLDVNGQLGDMSKLDFTGDPIESSTQKLIDSIQKLVDALTGPNGAAAALDKVGNKVVSPVVRPRYDGSGLPDSYAPTDQPDFGGAMAAGGDFYVTKPTWFLAGEAGPERATFSGANKAGSGPAGGVTFGDIYITAQPGTDGAQLANHFIDTIRRDGPTRTRLNQALGNG